MPLVEENPISLEIEEKPVKEKESFEGLDFTVD